MPKFSLMGVNGDKVFHGALVSRTRDSSVTMHWSVFRFRFGYEVGLIHILKGFVCGGSSLMVLGGLQCGDFCASRNKACFLTYGRSG